MLSRRFALQSGLGAQGAVKVFDSFFLLSTFMRLFEGKFDLVYLTPAFLCFTAFLAGIIPCAFCLDSTVFAYISIGIFLFSIAVHIYILFYWKRYRDSSPLAYALTQPAAHIVIMTFALCVGTTNVCTPVKHGNEALALPDNNLFQHNIEMPETIPMTLEGSLGNDAQK